MRIIWADLDTPPAVPWLTLGLKPQHERVGVLNPGNAHPDGWESRSVADHRVTCLLHSLSGMAAAVGLLPWSPCGVETATSSVPLLLSSPAEQCSSQSR